MWGFISYVFAADLLHVALISGLWYWGMIFYIKKKGRRE
jgi:hypothetical protein